MSSRGGIFSCVFWRNVYWSALVTRKLPCLEKCFWLHACTQVLFLAKCYLKCLTVSWTCLCLSNCSVICTVTVCYVLHQTHSELWHIQNSVYSGICRLIQSYPAPSVIFAHSQPCHIPHPNMSRIKNIFKTLWNLTRHIQNPVIFTKTSKSYVTFEIQNPNIFTIL